LPAALAKEVLMARIEFDKSDREMLACKITAHLRDELNIEIAAFDAVLLLDFLAETLGPHYYNQGLKDAQAIVASRADAIVEAIYEIEKPVRR